MKMRIFWVVGVLGIVSAAVVVGYWLGANNSGRRGSVASIAGQVGVESNVLYWYDPMVPDQHFDKPGKSPFMDMELVPKYAESDSSPSITIAASTAQNLGVRTQVVEVAALESRLRVPGSINWNLRESRELSARADGIVERLFVRAPFEQVQAGQALIRFVAPAWAAAAQEYLVLEKLTSDDAETLRAAARQRLRVLGMDDAQVRSLRDGADGIALRAPLDGVVTELMVREGQRVQAGASLMTINGLDTVWAEAAIPQAQAGSIRPGMPVVARASAWPGEVFSGKVESLLVDIDVGTRTQAARIVLENREHRLVPGLFVELEFDSTSGKPRPLVPDSALIATGLDSRVIIESENGRFVPVRVVTGRSSGGSTEILEGLSGGENVVVSGQFLIDSEASLSGALDRLSAGENSATRTTDPDEITNAHDHEMMGHDMSGHDMSGHEMGDSSEKDPQP